MSEEIPIFIDTDSCPSHPISCVDRVNMKYLEKREECFVLEFDPNDVADSSDTCSIKKNLNEVFLSDDVTIVYEKGQVACRDYPHPRHFCVKHPFEKTKHVDYCKFCYCYVCDVSAPCQNWTLHCHAFDNEDWQFRRANRRQNIEVMNFLNIQPTELKFTFELRKQSSCSFQLTNKTDQYVAFKFRTTNPKNYCVRPNAGVVLPGSTCNVTVTMQGQKEAPLDMKSKDKFLIQSVVAPNGTTSKEVVEEMFNKQEGKIVDEFKLGVVYIPANHPSVVLGGAEEGSPPGSSDGRRNIEVMNFLDIQPTELKFTFELRKHSLCSFQLTNKTDQYVAFKVKTTNPKRYYVRPNAGVVLPGLTCNVTVTMLMKSKDKFLIQSVVAPNGATSKEVTEEMFNKQEGKVVDEFKLQVVYIPVVLEGAEEGSPPGSPDAVTLLSQALVLSLNESG